LVHHPSVSFAFSYIVSKSNKNSWQREQCVALRW
jgi:hypothetical protein